MKVEFKSSLTSFSTSSTDGAVAILNADVKVKVDDNCYKSKNDCCQYIQPSHVQLNSLSVNRFIKEAT
jgi:hypothetical protein